MSLRGTKKIILEEENGKEKQKENVEEKQKREENNFIKY